MSKKPTLGRQIFPAVALTVIGVGFISQLDNPGSEVVLEGAIGAVTPSTLATNTTLAPSPVISVEGSGTCDGDVVTGPTAVFKWGGLQLQATFTKKNVLCNVTVLNYPNEDDKSLSINQSALPVYNQEATEAGSAQIAVVSGATDSWRAYTAGLQAILDAHPA
ncbi:MAG: FMN-binding protein [Ilumatobacteraceae bacterium]|nr:FMN-binding protein [Ilumatobacteraceae bacterium]